MLKRIRQLLQNNDSFGFETTLSGKMWLPLIQEAHNTGYRVVCIFIYLENISLALSRIRERVRKRGHDIPSNVVKRRFKNGLINFWKKYRFVCDDWILFNNSNSNVIRVAEGNKSTAKVYHKKGYLLWEKLVKSIEKKA